MTIATRPTTLDPITIEVIENRLTEIGWEGGITLQRTAASPSVVEAKDMGFNVADHLGRTIVYSTWMPRHGTNLAFMLRACRQRFTPEEIFPGDVFLNNNPHDGPLHNLDLAVFAPVFAGDELVAWTGCASHHPDIGGITPGRSPEATNWFQEGLIFRPIKLVERGRFRQDIFDFFLDNVRMPRYQGIDLKAQVSSVNVARDRILEVAKRYGSATLKAAYEEIIAFSEAKARARIRELAPGRYQAVDVVDYDRNYVARCTLEVKDDTITFDFSGTDPQSNTFINAARACTIANVHNIVACLLMPDITANEGSLRPIQFDLPEGTLLSCTPPAACSGASTITGWKAQCLAIATLSQALRCSPHLWRANALWGAGFVDVQISGIDPQRRWFTMRTGEVMHGGGARANKDGFDVANIAGSTSTSLFNIEAMEQRFPVLFLGRGYSQDSEGAGTYRSGLSGDYLVKLHGIEEADLTPFYYGRDWRARGLSGGEPGAPSLIKLKRDTNIEAILALGTPSYDEIGGVEEVLPQRNTPSRLRQGDVIWVRGQAGGGYGDPLERAPAAVTADAREGYVSRQRAREAYGVVLDDSAAAGFDAAGTEGVRAERRRQRLVAEGSSGA